MAEENRVCYRCLIRDISQKDYEENIEKYVKAISEADRVEKVECDRRLKLCLECDNLNAGTCMKCGCYVEIRAAMSLGHCPMKKW